MNGKTIDRVRGTILGITVHGTAATVKVAHKKGRGPCVRCKVTDPTRRVHHPQHPHRRQMRNGPSKEYKFSADLTAIEAMDEVQLTDWFRDIAEKTFPHLLP